jgi:hypothetical protein
MSWELPKPKKSLPGCQLSLPNVWKFFFSLSKDKKKIGNFVTHGKGLKLDPSGFLAPSLSLLIL